MVPSSCIQISKTVIVIFLWNIFGVRDGYNGLLDFCDRISNDRNKKNSTSNNFWWKLCKALFCANDLKQNKVNSSFYQDFSSCKDSSFCKSSKRSLLIVQLFVKIYSHQEIFGLVLKMS